ncbi:hypothetical protein SCLCIDRAFT_1209750 [Scleroderma citrinum Foug A]|uniref:Uncharacterized protein n=1 Tax=Scleroderma citrinum Foug A TaxID=1036808 RepID=A0A0C3E6A1_9AGAM|nr:hypothetical protein SCLCIDRAFT_1209750 [Scleroderma citrinum Foug A]
MLHQHIEIAWAPDHNNIVGNERADAPAQVATELIVGEYYKRYVPTEDRSCS